MVSGWHQGLHQLPLLMPPYIHSTWLLQHVVLGVADLLTLRECQCGIPDLSSLLFLSILQPALVPLSCTA
jgi:hypothetical protein